jgi:AcrR family transcriptional regulator
MIEEELTPRERRFQRTQQAILTAARALLADGGADKLSMRAIADRIDYSPAGLYEYYGSKEEIICALSFEGHRTLKNYMACVPLTLPPDQYMIGIGVAYIQFALQNPDYFMLIFTTPLVAPSKNEENPGAPPDEMMSDASSFPLLLQGVARAVETGTLHLRPGQSILEMAYIFWAIVHGAAMLRVSHMNLDQMGIDFDTADKQMMAALIRGMGS